MAFYVGQKVRCVDDDDRDEYSIGGFGPIVGDLDGLRRGATYTVARVYHEYGALTLDLVEIVRARVAIIHSDGFDARRFRPLVERKTDISIFTKLLIPSNLEREEA